MATVDSVLADIQNFRNEIPKKAIAGTSVVMLKLKDDLQIAAPVDSGTYRSGWTFKKNQTNTRKIASASTGNSTFYGIAIELGSKKGNWPWPNVASKTAFGGDGRIYSTQAFQGLGGTVRPIVTDKRVSAMAEQIADRIMTGLK